MARIKLHDKFFVTYLTHDEIEDAVGRVAKEISADYADKGTPVILSVLNGSFMFTSSLMQKLEIQVELSFIKLSSYSGTQTSGEVKEIIGLSQRLDGRDVIIVEDIVDTGLTIVELVKLAKEQGAKSIKVCTLLYKPGSYNKDVPIDYVAKEIPNDFVVGYGLDYNQAGRQYKDIYVLDLNQQ